MKKYFLLIILSAPLFAMSQTSATARGGSGGSESSYYAYGNGDFSRKGIDVYSKDATYVVIKLWNQDEPLTEKEKKDFSTIKQQLLAKGVTAIEYNWKTKEDIVSLFKKQEVAADVSSEDGLYIKSGDITISSTSTKALFIVENKKAKNVCIGNNCENSFLKRFFEVQDL
jgi:hypothetical protein